MTFVPHTAEQRAKMLREIGVESFEELLTIPRELLLDRDLTVPAATGEVELARRVNGILAQNREIPLNRVFAGGGVYPHHVPAVVDEISHRGEFYTAYTPYQPEVSQGMLQCIFEYQSYICMLTGMEISNASGYDGGTVLADSVLMAHFASRGKKKKAVFMPHVNPEAREVVETYNIGKGLETVDCPPGENGFACQGKLGEVLDGDTCAVVFQYPNCLGYLEDKLPELIEQTHEAGALAIVMYYPYASGLLKTPGEMGADIVCGEAQCLGNYMGFGGPLLGFIGCTEKLIRVMPGRLIGKTTCERNGEPGEGFVMTLQAREQHIRRDKAMSNICSNEALLALRTCIYLGAIGKQGFERIARACHDTALTAHARLIALDGAEDFYPGRHFFNEFTLKFAPGKREEILKAGIERGILAGSRPGCRGHEGLVDALTFAFTEVHGDEDVDALVGLIKEVL